MDLFTIKEHHQLQQKRQRKKLVQDYVGALRTCQRGFASQENPHDKSEKSKVPYQDKYSCKNLQYYLGRTRSMHLHKPDGRRCHSSGGDRWARAYIRNGEICFSFCDFLSPSNARQDLAAVPCFVATTTT